MVIGRFVTYDGGCPWEPNDFPADCSPFCLYSGVKLPLKLHTELDDDGLRHRITFFRGHYTADESLSRVEKVVYGEIEFTHDYQYTTMASSVRPR